MREWLAVGEGRDGYESVSSDSEDSDMPALEERREEREWAVHGHVNVLYVDEGWVEVRPVHADDALGEALTRPSSPGSPTAAGAQTDVASDQPGLAAAEALGERLARLVVWSRGRFLGHAIGTESDEESERPTE
jgi:hypothetical protein